MKVGVILMALALALLVAAVVVSFALRSEPERVVAAEVATNSPGEASRYSSGQIGSASKNTSSHKEFPFLLWGAGEGVAEVQLVLLLW